MKKTLKLREEIDLWSKVDLAGSPRKQATGISFGLPTEAVLVKGTANEGGTTKVWHIVEKFAALRPSQLKKLEDDGRFYLS